MINRLHAAKKRVEKALDARDIKELFICLRKFANLYAESHALGKKSVEYHYAEHIKLLIYAGLFSELDFDGEYYNFMKKADKELIKAGMVPKRFGNKLSVEVKAPGTGKSFTLLGLDILDKIDNNEKHVS